MIQPNELRIGNYFHPCGQSDSMSVNMPATAIMYRVGSVNKFGDVEVIEPEQKETYKFRYKEIHPVSLSPDILEQLGFKEKKDNVQVDMARLCQLIIPIAGANENALVCLFPKDGSPGFGTYATNGYWSSNNFSYVHQLQNLFHALTGQELQIVLK